MDRIDKEFLGHVVAGACLAAPLYLFGTPAEAFLGYVLGHGGSLAFLRLERISALIQDSEVDPDG